MFLGESDYFRDKQIADSIAAPHDAKGVAFSRESNKDLSFLVIQFKRRAESHLLQLGLVLWIPILDTISEAQGSNGLSAHPHVHVHERLKDSKASMSSLAFLAAELPDPILTSDRPPL